MNTFLIIIFIILVIIIAFLFYYNYLANKFNELIIKINEVDNKIDNNLKEKYDLLDKSILATKELIKLDKKLPENIMKLRARKGTNFEFDKTLLNLNNDFLAIYETKKDLKKDETISKMVKHIANIDEELITYRNYYNEKTTNYNKMLNHFPANIVAKIKKLSPKAFYLLEETTDNKDEEPLGEL